MQIFFRENLVLFAVPKTGTTAWEMVLKRRADISFGGNRKHTSVAFYQRHIAPFLQRAYNSTPERVAVIREPLDHARSWYRYRTRDELTRSRKSTCGISFDAFLRATIQDRPPPFANVGNQAAFLSLRDGSVPVHHVFTYDAMPEMRHFLQDRFNREFTLKTHNQSPDADTTASPETLALFRAARAADYDLYERAQAADGHLHQLVDDTV